MFLSCILRSFAWLVVCSGSFLEGMTLDLHSCRKEARYLPIMKSNPTGVTAFFLGMRSFVTSFQLERDVGLRCSTRVVGGVELQVQLAQADQMPPLYNADSFSFPLCLDELDSCSGEMRHRLHLAVTISHDAFSH